jgi:uncharacterized membrane protein
MGKKAKARRESGAREIAPKFQHPVREAPNWLLFGLSCVGLLLTAYLSWTAFNGTSVRGCKVGSSCDIVLTSKWATLLGIPTSFWGMLAYATLAATSFIRRVDRHWMIAWTVAMFGWFYSLYLTTVSLTVLHAACPYCLTSLTLMTVIFGVVSFQHPANMPSVSWSRWLVRTVPVGVAAILALHLQYAGVFGEPPQAEDPMARALAEHLVTSGAKMYGAFWCPHCQQQKAMFGRSANRLPYIECSPNGQNGPIAEECRKEGINSYPTWVIDGKHMEEVMTPQKLSELTHFK